MVWVSEAAKRHIKEQARSRHGSEMHSVFIGVSKLEH